MNQDKNEKTDSELMQDFVSGDENAFNIIVSRYKNGLYMFLRRFLNDKHMVEDVFQETFLQLFSSRDHFDTSRPLKPWLFTIAANKAKDTIRKIQRNKAMTIGTAVSDEQMSFQDVLDSMASRDNIPTNDLERNEAAGQVREVIAEMPEHLKEILILAYFNKFTYKQMASALKIPIGTVKSRLHTAVNRFTKDYTHANGSTH